MKKLFKIALLAGIVVGILKLKAAKDKLHGMTEEEVRAKLDSKMSGKVPPEKAEFISDTVIGKMRQRGVLREEPVSTSTTGSAEAAD